MVDSMLCCPQAHFSIKSACRLLQPQLSHGYHESVANHLSRRASSSGQAKGWTCGFVHMRSDLTSTRGLKNKTPPIVTPCNRQKKVVYQAKMLVSIGCGQMCGQASTLDLVLLRVRAAAAKELGMQSPMELELGPLLPSCHRCIYWSAQANP